MIIIPGDREVDFIFSRGRCRKSDEEEDEKKGDEFALHII